MRMNITAFRKSILHGLILGGVFLIPLVWSRYLNANFVSAKFFLVYLVSSFSLFASSKELIWPKCPRPLFYSLATLIVLQLSSPLLSGAWVDILYVFKFLSFTFLAYYFYSLRIDLTCFLKKFDLILFLTAFAILGVAAYDFYVLRVEELDVTSGFLLGSFGNVNMLAEFLVLTLPLIHLWGRTKTKTPQILKDALMLGWFFFIIYCRSRSAWIGLGLWVIWCLTQKTFSWKEAALLLIAFVGFHVSFYFPHIENTNAQAKTNSFAQRLHLYMTTVKLIADHPIGIGVGQYFHEIVPYLVNSDFRPLEYVYFDQPHSEFLKWAVQFGWVGVILPVVVLGYLGFYTWKQKNFFLLSSLIVLLPQLAFQFPFENPASLLYLAFLFAVALRIFPEAKEVCLAWWKRLAFFGVALVGLVHACLFVTSIFFETSHGNNVTYIKGACELYPINLNGCFFRDQFLIGTNRLEDSRAVLKQDFEKFPFHAGLMRILPAFLKSTNDNQKICESVLIYDFVYDKQTFFNTQILKACSAYKVPVTYYTAEQFRDDYVKWIRKVLQ